MKSLRKPFFMFCGLVLLASLLHAEDVTTTDGQVFSNTTIRRSGSMIMIKILLPGSTSMMEMGLPIARIAKIGFAEPPELAKAKDAASKGNAQEVLNLTGASMTAQANFKDVPGSWWFSLAQLRLLALASLGKDVETANLAREIGATKAPGSETLARGGTLFAALASSDTEAISVGAKGLPRIGGDTGSALAQLALGRALYIKRDYAAALRAFLTIKIFYPSLALLQPPSLLGVANSYVGLEDPKRALQTFQDIVSLWPDSPQATEAKKRADILSHS